MGRNSHKQHQGSPIKNRDHSDSKVGIFPRGGLYMCHKCACVCMGGGGGGSKGIPVKTWGSKR